MEKLQIIINATDNCITENMNLYLFEIICPNRLVVLKIHDNVFWGLHYTIFCIRMDFRRIRILLKASFQIEIKS